MLQKTNEKYPNSEENPQENLDETLSQEQRFLVRYKNREGEINSGPLDLLWSLITGYEVNIFDVSLTRITLDFLGYMREHVIPLEEESGFALMAARLLYYKSKLLLPNPAFDDEDESSDQLPLELVEQLLEYKRYQIAAEYFKELESTQSMSAMRDASWNEFEEGIEFLKIDLLSFLKAFQEFQDREEKQKPILIEAEEINLEQIIELIRENLQKNKSFSFLGFVKNFSLLKFSVSFFAILELNRLGEITLVQEKLFSDIIISEKEVAA